MERKIYFNNRFIKLINTPEKDIENCIEYDDTIDLNSLIRDFDNDSSKKSISIVSPDLDKLWKKFSKCCTCLDAAGGLVNDGTGRYLFIFRRGHWDLPKGKAEKGETTKQTALREVQEETGLKAISIVAPICTTYHTYSLKNKFILKSTHWFVMLHKGNEKLKLQTEEDIEDAQWLTVNSWDEIFKNTYSTIVDVLQVSQKTANC